MKQAATLSLDAPKCRCPRKARVLAGTWRRRCTLCGRRHLDMPIAEALERRIRMIQLGGYEYGAA